MFNSNWLLTFYSVHWLEGVCVKVFSLYRCLEFFCVDFQGFFCPNSAKVSCHLPVPQLWVISVDFGSLIFYSRQTLSPSQLPVSSNFWLLRTKILLLSSPPSSGNSQIPWPRSIYPCPLLMDACCVFRSPKLFSPHSQIPLRGFFRAWEVPHPWWSFLSILNLEVFIILLHWCRFSSVW